MFERAAVDNSNQLRTTAVPADIKLTDGHELRGKFHIRGDRTIIDILNGTGQFLDFEPYSGERQLISKSAIRSIKIVNVPTPRQLPNVNNAREAFDPFKILGLQKSASMEDVKKAYHNLSKQYHPDRYANAGLPNEVLDYINAVSRRLNAAFAALKESATQPIQRPHAPSPRSKPIYTSPGRLQP